MWVLTFVSAHRYTRAAEEVAEHAACTGAPWVTNTLEISPCSAQPVVDWLERAAGEICRSVGFGDIICREAAVRSACECAAPQPTAATAARTITPAMVHRA